MLQLMPYSQNPFLPKARRDAVNLVRLKGFGVRQAAERIGVSPGTISKWLQKAPVDGRCGIPTLSSAPHTHPNAIAPEIVSAIIAERRKHGRCGEAVHQALLRQGIVVSLPTVQRTLRRHGLVREWSPWKKRHPSSPRPEPALPGALVEVDTIHEVPVAGRRFYVYTLLDVHSRWAHAWVTRKISAGMSLMFLAQARRRARFPFEVVQSDHGPEFSRWFTAHLPERHRHIRVGKPNDDAHVERFNRTIQDECFRKLPRRPEDYAKALPKYLRYYNAERLHMGLGYMTPEEKVATVFPRC